MPSIDVDIGSVPDIIEAQLTLSYSRLTDLIRVIVDQGNGHEDDIDDLRERLAKLAQENGALRSEVEALRQSQGPGASVAAALDELKATVQQLSEKADANAAQLATVAAAQSTLTESVEKQAEARQAKLQAALAEHAAAVDRRFGAVEKSAQVAQAFADLWGAAPEQVLAMGRRNTSHEIEHSLKDRTTFLLSMPAFAKMREELDVLRALMQRQAADALAAKTTEVARTSRTASIIAAQHDSREPSAEVGELAKAVQTLEQQLQLVEKQRLPPLESALGELQGRGSATERMTKTEKDVSRLHDQLGQLEDRLNTLLGMAGEKSASDGAAAQPALVDLARRVSLLEGTVEGLPRGGTDPRRPSSTTSADAPGGGAGGEVVSAETNNAGNAYPSAAKGQPGRPPSGRPGSGLLPSLGKDTPSSSSTTAASKVSPPPRRSSSLLHTQPGSSSDLVQPTVEALRRQEAAQPAAMGGGRRISVAVEPDDGLRRRVAQVEENAAILEVSKADRKELQQLEAALRQALSSMSRPHSGTAQSSPSLIPQRPVSAGGRYVHNYATSPAPEATQGYRGDGSSRPASASGALGRPMFVGSASSVFLRDGAQLTNATVSSTGDSRT